MTRQLLPERQLEMVPAKRGAEAVGRGHHQQTGLAVEHGSTCITKIAAGSDTSKQ
jgi:hypothetical protein